MKDFSVLRDLPELAPLPGQSEAALALVHHRRRRSAVRTGSAACALVVAAVLLTTKSPSTSLLEPTREGVVQTATAVPSPTGHGGEADSAAGPRLATGAGGAAEENDVSATPVAASGSTVSTPSPGVTGDAPSVRPRPEMVRERYSHVTNPMHINGGRRGCGPMAGDECSVVNQKVTGDVITFTVTLCAGTTDRYLSFPTEQESDVVIYDAKDVEVWRWGRGQVFAQTSHEEHLAPEECLAWSTDWDFGDERGDRVAPGRYRVMLPILADPLRNMGTSVTVEE